MSYIGTLFKTWLIQDSVLFKIPLNRFHCICVYNTMYQLDELAIVAVIVW